MSRREVVIVAVAIALLLGMGVQAALRPGPGDAEPFHCAVLAAADRMPRQVGDWVGADQPPTRAAETAAQTQRAHPTTVSQRRVRPMGDAAAGADQRRRGHERPLPTGVLSCARGCKRAAMPIDLTLGGMAIPATEYEFSLTSEQGPTSMNVIDFMVMPGGPILRDITGVARAAADYNRYFYGAAQVQVVTPSDWSDAKRQQVAQELLTANREILQLLWAGETAANVGP